MISTASVASPISAHPAEVEPFVEIQNVTKTFVARGRELEAIKGITLDLKHGEFVAVVGPSGCGKSTLMMMVAGLMPLSGGQITIGQKKIVRPYTDAGVIFQRDALLEWRNVLENVLLQIDVRRLKRSDYEEAARSLLARVGLGEFENYYPWELSGGMRQRVALCRGLIHDPSLLLLDEPFGALDALTREQMNLDLQRIWLETRKTMLFITHSIWEAVFLADRVVVITPRPGRVAAVIEIQLPRPRRLAVRETQEFGNYAAVIREQFQAFGLLNEN